jgi:hypothetical protein
MQSTRARVAVLIGAVAVIVVLFVVLNSGGNNSTTSTDASTGGVATLTYKNGEVQGGEQTLTYTKGDQIQIQVNSDIETDAHLHGYNVEIPTGPGKPANFNLPADLEGVFDLELHLPNGEVSMATVKVNPS